MVGVEWGALTYFSPILPPTFPPSVFSSSAPPSYPERVRIPHHGGLRRCDRESPRRELASRALGSVPRVAMPLLGRQTQSRMLLPVLRRAGSDGGGRTESAFRQARDGPESVLEGDREERERRKGIPRGWEIIERGCVADAMGLSVRSPLFHHAWRGGGVFGRMVITIAVVSGGAKQFQPPPKFDILTSLLYPLSPPPTNNPGITFSSITAAMSYRWTTTPNCTRTGYGTIGRSP